MSPKYEPLRTHLSAMAESVVVMTYEDIETILGGKLPNTAYGASWRQWWANTETHSQALAWLRAGWRVTRPDLANKRIEFRRQTDEPERSGECPTTSNAGAGSSTGAAVEGIVVSLEHLTPSALRLVEDAAEELSRDLGYAAAELINQAAMARRRQLLDWFANNAPGGGTSSVELIREDRDTR